MIPDYGLQNFFPEHENQCTCEYCSSLNLDWTKPSGTDNMVKASILKANIMAELNSSGSDI